MPPTFSAVKVTLFQRGFGPVPRLLKYRKDDQGRPIDVADSSAKKKETKKRDDDGSSPLAADADEQEADDLFFDLNRSEIQPLRKLPSFRGQILVPFKGSAGGVTTSEGGGLDQTNFVAMMKDRAETVDSFLKGLHERITRDLDIRSTAQKKSGENHEEKSSGVADMSSACHPLLDENNFNFSIVRLINAERAIDLTRPELGSEPIEAYCPTDPRDSLLCVWRLKRIKKEEENEEEEVKKSEEGAGESSQPLIARSSHPQESGSQSLVQSLSLKAKTDDGDPAQEGDGSLTAAASSRRTNLQGISKDQVNPIDSASSPVPKPKIVQQTEDVNESYNDDQSRLVSMVHSGQKREESGASDDDTSQNSENFIVELRAKYPLNEEALKKTLAAKKTVTNVKRAKEKAENDRLAQRPIRFKIPSHGSVQKALVAACRVINQGTVVHMDATGTMRGPKPKQNSFIARRFIVAPPQSGGSGAAKKKTAGATTKKDKIETLYQDVETVILPSECSFHPFVRFFSTKGGGDGHPRVEGIVEVQQNLRGVDTEEEEEVHETEEKELRERSKRGRSGSLGDGDFGKITFDDADGGHSEFAMPPHGEGNAVEGGAKSDTELINQPQRQQLSLNEESSTASRGFGFVVPLALDVAKDIDEGEGTLKPRSMPRSSKSSDRSRAEDRSRAPSNRGFVGKTVSLTPLADRAEKSAPKRETLSAGADHDEDDILGTRPLSDEKTVSALYHDELAKVEEEDEEEEVDEEEESLAGDEDEEEEVTDNDEEEDELEEEEDSNYDADEEEEEEEDRSVSSVEEDVGLIGGNRNTAALLRNTALNPTARFQQMRNTFLSEARGGTIDGDDDASFLGSTTAKHSNTGGTGGTLSHPNGSEQREESTILLDDQEGDRVPPPAAGQLQSGLPPFSSRNAKITAMPLPPQTPLVIKKTSGADGGVTNDRTALRRGGITASPKIPGSLIFSVNKATLSEEPAQTFLPSNLKELEEEAAKKGEGEEEDNEEEEVGDLFNVNEVIKSNMKNVSSLFQGAAPPPLPNVGGGTILFGGGTLSKSMSRSQLRAVSQDLLPDDGALLTLANRGPSLPGGKTPQDLATMNISQLQGGGGASTSYLDNTGDNTGVRLTNHGLAANSGVTPAHPDLIEQANLSLNDGMNLFGGGDDWAFADYGDDFWEEQEENDEQFQKGEGSQRAQSSQRRRQDWERVFDEEAGGGDENESTPEYFWKPEEEALEQEEDPADGTARK